MKTFDDDIAPFYAFIHAQPDSRTVNNRTWTTCIVGDYIREVLSPTSEVEHYATKFIHNWWNQDIVPYALFRRFSRGEFTTYGEAKDALDALEL